MSDTTTNQPLAEAAAALATAEQALKTAETTPAATLTPAAGLDAWIATLRDTAIARDTAAWNRIFNAVQEIKAAIAAVKEN